MGLFGDLFGDARAGAAAAQSTINAQTAGSRQRISGAAALVDQRAQASAGEMRAMADAFRALGDAPSALERQSAQRGARERTNAASRQQALAAGPQNAQRLMLAEQAALAQGQALMAGRHQRIQKQMQVNQVVGQALAQAGQFSQAGASARLSALSQFEQTALQAQSQAALARAQAEAQPSGLGRFIGGAMSAAAGMFSFGGGGTTNNA